MDAEGIALLDWLAKETLRDRSGVIRWALSKAAKELGYVPKGRKKGGS
jgi:hypothetical protein